jgi:aminopeptidase N
MKRPPLGAPLAGALILLATLSCRSSTVAPPATLATDHPPRVEPVDVEHYGLELSLNPEERSVDGRCTVRFAVVAARLEVLELELEGLEARSVTDADGVPLDFRQDAGRLEIELGAELLLGDLGEVVVEYGGRPAKGLWFVAGEDGEVDQVWTQGECVDAHWWFPCIDHPGDRATSELLVHMPAGWVAVAAGERVELLERDGVRSERWRMATPHPTYLTTLCAGEFRVLEGEWDGIPLLFLSDPALASWMPAAFEETDEILAFFSELTGRRYPYSKYAQACVANFPFGGMENISATTLTESTLTDAAGCLDGGSHGLVAHEAAHQWFGDLLTCESWSEIWLNEGFATYLTNLYFEHSRGVDDFRVRMRDTQRGYMAADAGAARRPTVHTVYRDPFDLFFDGKAYAGGASRLHLLRFVLGDEDFFAGLRRYVAENAGRAVTTEDLREAMETASGRSLERFFDQWLYGAGHPELEVRWSWDEALGQVEVEVEQLQGPDRGTPDVFQMPVEVEVFDAAGRRTKRFELDRRKQTLVLEARTEPIWVRFDKHGWLPARITSLKRPPEWLAIAAEDDDVNGRRDAVQAIGQLLAGEQDPERVTLYFAALLRRLRDDTSAAVRRGAVEALATRLEVEGVRGSLAQAAAGDRDADVREAALLALRGVGPDEELAAFADEQFDLGYSWDVRVAAARLFAAAAPARSWEWVRARCEVPSPHGVLQAGLVDVLVGLEHPELLPELRRVAADPAAPSAARRSAVRGLAVRGRFDAEARDLLLELLGCEDYRLRQEAIDALGGFRGGAVDARLRRELEESVHSRERRKLEAALRQVTRSSGR